MSFYCRQPIPDLPFPACLQQKRLLIPGRRSMLGRKLLNWINSKGLRVEFWEFDDAALMNAFAIYNNAIFVAPTMYAADTYAKDDQIVEIGRLDGVQEKYYVIFAERMIQHPAVQRVCNKDFSALFSGWLSSFESLVTYITLAKPLSYLN